MQPSTRRGDGEWWLDGAPIEPDANVHVADQPIPNAPFVIRAGPSLVWMVGASVVGGLIFDDWTAGLLAAAVGDRVLGWTYEGWLLRRHGVRPSTSPPDTARQ